MSEDLSCTRCMQYDDDGNWAPCMCLRLFGHWEDPDGA